MTTKLPPSPWTTVELPILQPKSVCKKPVRCIKDRAKDLDRFRRSVAFHRVTSFIYALNLSAGGRAISAVSKESPRSRICKDLVHILDHVIGWAHEIEPHSGNQRFGNTAFRVWNARLEEQSAHLLSLLTEEPEALEELKTYFDISFGNSTRIDYGSGHELNFVAFLTCLSLLGLLPEESHCEIVLIVFKRYMEAVQVLIDRYRLEPAGSHGVWGLDDYRFLSYYFGAAQLALGEPPMQPGDVLKTHLIHEWAEDYLYMWCIDKIFKVKSGPFFEHSRTLYDISGALSWYKVNQGLGRMYLNEVLGKFPVVQHFVFGGLLPFHEFVGAPTQQ